MLPVQRTRWVHNWNARLRRVDFSAVWEAIHTVILQKMGRFVAMMGHKAICYDISNIMKIDMMVAANCKAENKC